jgi:hypothetical protein
MDFIGPFPKSNGYDYLWVVICRLTSMVHLIPVKTTIKASELASIYVKEIVRIHGLPDSIVSDRDPKFTSKFWKETHQNTRHQINDVYSVPPSNGWSLRMSQIGQ